MKTRPPRKEREKKTDKRPVYVMIIILVFFFSMFAMVKIEKDEDERVDVCGFIDDDSLLSDLVIRAFMEEEMKDAILFMNDTFTDHIFTGDDGQIIYVCSVPFVKKINDSFEAKSNFMFRISYEEFLEFKRGVYDG